MARSWRWGWNKTSSSSPVPALPPGLAFADVANGGYFHTLAIFAATGRSSRGEETADRSVQRAALPPGSPTPRPRQVAISSAAVRSDGALVAHGVSNFQKPEERARASAGTHVHARRRGRELSRWRAAATDPLAAWGTTPTDSATCRGSRGFNFRRDRGGPMARDGATAQRDRHRVGANRPSARSTSRRFRQG